MAPKVETITIERRFRGPPESGNGGYSCGRAATFVDGVAKVVLRAPPPLETPLAVERADGTVRFTHDGTLVMEAKRGTFDVDPPRTVSLEQARAATAPPEFFTDHVFPYCFVCGPSREEGDGLRIFAGKVAGRDEMATVWTPHDSLAGSDGFVRSEFLWAALDCPTAWTAFESNPTGHVIMLGTMIGEVVRGARAGEPIVVTAEARGAEGRKHIAASALYTPDGELVARAETIWIALT